MGYQLLLLMKKTGHFLLSKELRKKKIPSLRAEIARPYNFKKYENKIDFSINSRYYKISNLKVKSYASYQVQNAALAAIAAHVLCQIWRRMLSGMAF